MKGSDVSGASPRKDGREATPKPARLDLFMTCQRQGCEGIRQVRNRWEQKTAKYCTRRCAALDASNLRKVDPRATGRLGGLVCGVRRRAATFEKVRTLTPMQAYRKGRMEGWHDGYRKALRRLQGTI